VSQAEFELKEVTADLEDKRGALAKATHDAKAAAKQLAALEVALPKATMELSSLTEQVRRRRRRRPDGAAALRSAASCRGGGHSRCIPPPLAPPRPG